MITGDVETSMGMERRMLQPAEIEKRELVRRSVFLKQDGLEGTKLKDLEIEYRRPGDGIAPNEWEQLSSGTLKRAVKVGEKLQMSDLII